MEQAEEIKEELVARALRKLSRYHDTITIRKCCLATSFAKNRWLRVTVCGDGIPTQIRELIAQTAILILRR